jgi:hypothetical protein
MQSGGHPQCSGSTYCFQILGQKLRPVNKHEVKKAHFLEQYPSQIKLFNLDILLTLFLRTGNIYGKKLGNKIKLD